MTGRPAPRARARQVAVPADAVTRSTLSHIDHCDAFVVGIDPAADRTGEQWARRLFQQTPIAVQHRLYRAWTLLGLRLASPGSEGFVLGWELRRSTPERALLGAESRLGMPADLLIECQHDTLFLATFVRMDNPLARLLWSLVEPQHRRVVPGVLELGVRPERPGIGPPLFSC